MLQMTHLSKTHRTEVVETSALRDFCLLRRRDVHDHTALQHFRQTRL